ncbi:gluconate 2-dehydrogenase subunit 3 family protein [Thalassotalea piscium]
MKETFFDSSYKTPKWLSDKLSRRKLLKAAAGTSALAIIPFNQLALAAQTSFDSKLKTDPWLTLDAVLNHLLPVSDVGVSAKDIQATYYLYQLVHQQPTAQDEIEFIYKGVGWLNGYAVKQTQQAFVLLDKSDKETMLRDISHSEAGDNWISMLISNLYEAMLSAPSYGGNPNGIGWKWLEHQAGFPLPVAGERYFELPKRSQLSAKISNHIIPTRHLSVSAKREQGKTKA